MTIQNAPPGLDYDRDKKFSKVNFFFKSVICIVKSFSCNDALVCGRCQTNVHWGFFVLLDTVYPLGSFLVIYSGFLSTYYMLHSNH